MKRCKECDQLKELDEFPKNNKLLTGYGGKCKDCMNAYYRDRKHKNKYDDVSRLMKYFSYKLENIKKQDERKFPDHKFDLTVDDLKAIHDRQNGYCIYSNAKLNYKKTTSIYKKISFDRIDNTKPHTKMNLQMTSVFMNTYRGDMSDDEFRDKLDQ